MNKKTKSEPSVTVKNSIKIVIGGKEIELTRAQAEQLSKQLSSALGRSSIEELLKRIENDRREPINQPIYPFPTIPTIPFGPTEPTKIPEPYKVWCGNCLTHTFTGNLK